MHAEHGEQTFDRTRPGAHTMVRTLVSVNGEDYFLAQREDVQDLMKRIEDAARTGGRFIDFVVVGNRKVHVLVSQSTRVMVSVETVEFDPRDDGDEGAPFGGLLDDY